MVKGEKKSFMTVSIFYPEEDFDLPKEVNRLAKKDPFILDQNPHSKKNLLSLVTRMLWKTYVKRRKTQNDAPSVAHPEEDTSSNEESDSPSVEE